MITTWLLMVLDAGLSWYFLFAGSQPKANGNYFGTSFQIELAGVIVVVAAVALALNIQRTNWPRGITLTLAQALLCIFVVPFVVILVLTFG
jgi:hypothetical protein